MSDRQIIISSIFVIRNGLRWCDAPVNYGPPKTICNRFIRWSRLGCLTRSSPPFRRRPAGPIN
ncbi:transposase [Sphingobium fuliginis]|uniref:Transposase n=1 Tax=Sphingobium fuliginis (strain ATCC 27551) TaxID=336203 RepID=A0A7M2GFQ6_SPHSA|nr:transposase [Sphingobium fuliginis]